MRWKCKLIFQFREFLPLCVCRCRHCERQNSFPHRSKKSSVEIYWIIRYSQFELFLSLLHLVAFSMNVKTVFHRPKAYFCRRALPSRLQCLFFVLIAKKSDRHGNRITSQNFYWKTRRKKAAMREKLPRFWILIKKLHKRLHHVSNQSTRWDA